jgi:hypothetical protein
MQCHVNERFLLINCINSKVEETNNIILINKHHFFKVEETNQFDLVFDPNVVFDPGKALLKLQQMQRKYEKIADSRNTVRYFHQVMGAQEMGTGDVSGGGGSAGDGGGGSPEAGAGHGIGSPARASSPLAKVTFEELQGGGDGDDLNEYDELLKSNVGGADGLNSNYNFLTDEDGNNDPDGIYGDDPYHNKIRTESDLGFIAQVARGPQGAQGNRSGSASSGGTRDDAGNRADSSTDPDDLTGDIIQHNRIRPAPPPAKILFQKDGLDMSFVQLQSEVLKMQKATSELTKVIENSHKRGLCAE